MADDDYFRPARSRRRRSFAAQVATADLLGTSRPTASELGVGERRRLALGREKQARRASRSVLDEAQQRAGPADHARGARALLEVPSTP